MRRFFEGLARKIGLHQPSLDECLVSLSLMLPSEFQIEAGDLKRASVSEICHVDPNGARVFDTLKVRDQVIVLGNNTPTLEQLVVAGRKAGASMPALEKVYDHRHSHNYYDALAGGASSRLL